MAMAKEHKKRGWIHEWCANIVDHKIIAFLYMVVSFLFGGVIVEELRYVISGIVTDYVARCNELATDPNDVNRGDDSGVELPDMSHEAFAMCKQAADRHPTNRVRYQYARATEKFGLIADAINLYQPLADSGYLAAQVRLGAVLVSIPERCQEGRHYIEVAASKNSSEAMLWLGRLYFQGLGIEKNRQKGISLMESAARDGNVHAMRYLAVLRSPPQN
jgi:hypothetical protein